MPHSNRYENSSEELCVAKFPRRRIFVNQFPLYPKPLQMSQSCSACRKEFDSSFAYCPHCGGLQPKTETRTKSSEVSFRDEVSKATVARVLGFTFVVLASVIFVQVIKPEREARKRIAAINANVDSAVLPVPHDTMAASKSADSIMEVIPISSIKRTPPEELVVGVGLIKGFPFIPAGSKRQLWLVAAEKRLGWDVQKIVSMPHERVVTSSARDCSGNQQLVANVHPGYALFLKSDCSEIGTIVDIAEDYRFPDGTERDAILISFKDGTTDWVPRQAAQLLYLTHSKD